MLSFEIIVQLLRLALILNTSFRFLIGGTCLRTLYSALIVVGVSDRNSTKGTIKKIMVW